MAGLKEIRRRITSVNNTRQITRAMKLVAAAKLKRAQDAAQGGRAYSDRLNGIVNTLVADLSGEFTHPLLEKAESVDVRRVIVISGDRGLCGGYNANVIKAVEAQELDSGVTTEFVAIGKRSVSTLARLGRNVISTHENLPENAALWPFEEMSRAIIGDYIAGRCQEVVLYYTKFVSALKQIVVRKVLLPFDVLHSAAGETVLGSGNVSRANTAEEKLDSQLLISPVGYSPEPGVILSELVPMLVRTRLLQAGLEAKASENASRMTAMDSATSNASDLIDKLKLYYNRARQSTITRELIDIVGGAEAIQ
ncbi:MAG: ATP synthase F1 subunit gamma [Deltaproteobacteria bacterium]|nr:ATP synthase F1 subunit gamma [Deltaproteobacteria bacterium]